MNEHPSLESLKKLGETAKKQVNLAEITVEQQKNVEETARFIEELTASLKVQRGQVEEIKRLLETEQTDIDELLKEALRVLIKHLK